MDDTRSGLGSDLEISSVLEYIRCSLDVLQNSAGTLRRQKPAILESESPVPLDRATLRCPLGLTFICSLMIALLFVFLLVHFVVVVWVLQWRPRVPPSTPRASRALQCQIKRQEVRLNLRFEVPTAGRG
jgi:hypothetical protein